MALHALLVQQQVSRRDETILYPNSLCINFINSNPTNSCGVHCSGCNMQDQAISQKYVIIIING